MTMDKKALPFILIIVIVGAIAFRHITTDVIDMQPVTSMQVEPAMLTAAPVEETPELHAITQAISGKVVQSNDLRIGEGLGKSIPLIEVPGEEGGQNIISTGQGTTAYRQYIAFGSEGENITSGSVAFTINDAGDVGDFLRFKEQDAMFEYGVVFDSGLESRVSSGRLKDLEGRNLNLLGHDYFVTKASINTDTKRIELRLDGGGSFVQLQESKKRQLMVGFIPYTIDTFVSSGNQSRAILTINGETTTPLAERESTVLKDGTRIAIISILPNDAGEGDDLVEAYIGSTSIRLTDFYGNTAFSRGLVVDGRSRSEGLVQITGNLAGTLFTIDSIKYRLEAAGHPGDVFIPPQSTLQETVPKTAGGFRTDISYKGLAPVQSSGIVFEPRGTAYYLTFHNSNGRKYSIPLNDGSGSLKYGDDDNSLLFTESAGSTTYTVNKKDYLVLTDKNTYKGNTYILRYDSLDTGNSKVVFEDPSTGNTLQGSYTATGVAGQLGEGSVIVGGSTFAFTVSTDGTLAMDLNGDGGINGATANIITMGGGRLSLGTVGGSSVTDQLITARQKQKNSTSDETVNIDITVANGDIDIDVANQGEIKMFKADSNTWKGMTEYGAYFELRGTKERRRKLSIDYPMMQRVAIVEIR